MLSITVVLPAIIWCLLVSCFSVFVLFDLFSHALITMCLVFKAYFLVWCLGLAALVVLGWVRSWQDSRPSYSRGCMGH